MGLTIDGLSRRGLPERRPFSEKKRKRGAPQEKPAPVRGGWIRRENLRSEQQRAEIAAMNRAIRDTEDALAIVSAAGEGLADVAAILTEVEEGLERLDAGGLSPIRENLPGEESAAGEGDSPSPEAWLTEKLAGLDRIAETTRFGKLRLLDGSLGCSGMALGDGLIFVSAEEETRSSPPEGYEILLSQEPTRPTLVAEEPLTGEVIRRGVALKLAEGRREALIRTRAGSTPAEIAEELQCAVTEAGLPLAVNLTRDHRLLVQHHRFGSGVRFTAGSSIPGVLSGLEGAPREVANGRDIGGTLNGEPARGEGQTLRGLSGNSTTAGLTVRYTGLPFTGATARLPRKRPAILEQGVFAGRVIVARQALAFQLEGLDRTPVFLRLDSVKSGDLGRDVENTSGMASLEGISCESPHRIRDSRHIVDAAIIEITARQGRLEKLSNGRLRDILARLQVSAQNLVAASSGQSIPLEADLTLPSLAREAVRSLSRRIGADGGPALAAQSRPNQNILHRLLNSEPTEEKGPW